MKNAIIVCVLIVSLLMAACTAESPPEDNGVIYQTVSGYFDEISEESFGVYNGDAIPTKECAISVATAIHGEIFDDCRVPVAVMYDEACGIWIVHFAKKSFSENVFIIGDECSIALRKNNGAIIRIWLQE